MHTNDAEQAAIPDPLDAALAEITDLCAHEPDEHPEGCCDLCDFASAMAGVVTDLAGRLSTQSATPESCPTPGCAGNPRYAAPGRRHVAGCTYPRNLSERGDSPDLTQQIAWTLSEHTYVPSGLRGVSKCACGVQFSGMPHQHRAHLAALLADRLSARSAGTTHLTEQDAFDLARDERARAHAKHGDRSMESTPWRDPTGRRLRVLLEEVGEVAREINDAEVEGRAVSGPHLATELVQVAAMAGAWADRILTDETAGSDGSEREVGAVLPTGPDAVQTLRDAADDLDDVAIEEPCGEGVRADISHWLRERARRLADMEG